MDFLECIKTHKTIFLIISFIFNIILIFTCVIFGYLYFSYDCTCPTPNLIAKETNHIEDNNKTLDEFYVEIKGAVNNPGVYKVNSDNIINDVITMADGFTNDAFTDNINLSKKVSKELVVFIYTKDEVQKDKKEVVKKVETKCVCPTYDITICTDELKSEIVPEEEKNENTNKTPSVSENNNDNGNNSNLSNTPSSDSQNKEEVVDNNLNKKVNINLATKSELMKLNGIGESKAQKIIDYRNKNGLFKSIEDIKKVSGIGDAIYGKIKDYITV